MKEKVTLQNVGSYLYPSSINSSIPSPAIVAESIADIALIEPTCQVGGEMKLLLGEEERTVFTRYKFEYELGVPIKEGVSQLGITAIVEYNANGKGYSLDLGFSERVLVCSNGAFIANNILRNSHKGASQIGLKAFMRGLISEEAFVEAIGKIKSHNELLYNVNVDVRKENEFAGFLLRETANKSTFFDGNIIRKALKFRDEADNAHKPTSDVRSVWEMTQDYTYFMKDNVEISTYINKHANLQESAKMFAMSLS